MWRRVEHKFEKVKEERESEIEIYGIKMTLKQPTIKKFILHTHFKIILLSGKGMNGNIETMLKRHTVKRLIQ